MPKLFRTNIGRLQRIRTDLKISYDHNKRILLTSVDNIRLREETIDKLQECINLLNKIEKQ